MLFLLLGVLLVHCVSFEYTSSLLLLLLLARVTCHPIIRTYYYTKSEDPHLCLMSPASPSSPPLYPSFSHFLSSINPLFPLPVPPLLFSLPSPKRLLRLPTATAEQTMQSRSQQPIAPALNSIRSTRSTGSTLTAAAHFTSAASALHYHLARQALGHGVRKAPCVCRGLRQRMTHARGQGGEARLARCLLDCPYHGAVCGHMYTGPCYVYMDVCARMCVCVCVCKYCRDLSDGLRRSVVWAEDKALTLLTLLTCWELGPGVHGGLSGMVNRG